MAEGGLQQDLSLDTFRKSRDYIHQHSGIYLEDSKLDSLRISLLTRASRLHMDSYDDYLQFLTRDADEFKELMNLVTINETSFFRFPQQFDALRDRVVGEIMANGSKTSHTLRVWSAGCSTGEEPYTISMTLADSGIEGLGWRYQVLGTDVSTRTLKRAQSAIYPKRSVQDLREDVVTRMFEPWENGSYRVADRVRRHVDFGWHNLIKEPYPLSLMGNWDIIFCRNVTIYFQLDSTRRVISNFYNSLNEGGYLFIGHSETLSSVSDEFEPVEVGGVFLYRKPLRRKSVSVFGAGGAFPRLEVASAARVPGAAESSGDRARARATEAASTSRRERAEAAGVATSDRSARPFRRVAETGSKSRTSETAGSKADRPAPAGEPSAADNLAAWVAEAKHIVTTGNPEKVHQLVARILDADPRNVDAFLLAAYAHADVGDYGEALAECDRALAINPLLPIARYILGVIYQRQGETARAVGEYKKTIYIDPNFVMAHLNLGNVYRGQGKWDAAAREYENATRALYKNPEGAWSAFLGGFKADLLVKTCERSLLECRKAMGIV